MAQGRQSTLDAISECPICLEIFKDPKQLPCDHTLCLDCLTHMAGDKTNIECPICRAKVDIPSGGVEELPNNLTMISLLEALQNTKRTTIYCDFCIRHNRRKKADHFCKQCCKYVCISCALGHKELAVFYDHETVAVEDQTIICPRHKDMYGYVCKDCSKLLCAYCVQSKKCKDHQVSKLVCEQDKMKDVIKELKSAVTMYNELQLSPTEAVDNELKSVVHQMERVKTHVVMLVKKIRVKGDELLETLKKRYDELQDMKKDIMTSYTNKASLLSSLKDAAVSAMKLSREHVTSILPNIREQMAAVMTLESQSDSVTQSLIFSPQKSIQLGQLKWKLNDIGLKRVNLAAAQKKNEHKEAEEEAEQKEKEEKERQEREKIEIENRPAEVPTSIMNNEDDESIEDLDEYTQDIEPVFWESSV